MKGNSKLIVSTLLVIFSVGCSGRMDEASYVQWVKDYENGLHVERMMGDYIFDLQYMPADFRWIQYKEQDRREEDDLQYYVLTIRPKSEGIDLVDFNITDEVEKQRKLYYFSYTLQNDLSVEENGKALPCVLYHFERPADMKDSRAFLLAFEKTPEASNEATLVINSPLLSSLPVKIRINKNNIPVLAL